MPSRKTTAGTAQLRAAQNQVRGNPNLRAGLSKARPLVPASEMQAFVNWLPIVRRNGQGIALDPFPRSIGQLWQYPTFAPVTLIRELAWASALFRSYAEVLRKFRKATERYEALLVEDRHEECRTQLDAIEKEFGTSLWVIETRLAFLQRADGLEAQKAYAANIQKARNKNDVVSFLTHHISRRNEPNTAPRRYVHQLADNVASWQDSDNLGSYVLHRLGNRFPAAAAHYTDILRHESSAALVDHYETFVRLSACAGAVGEKHIKAAFRPEALQVATAVDDERLRRSAFLLSDEEQWLDGLPASSAQIEDAFVNGNYERASALAQADFVTDPDNASAWIAAAHSLSIDNTSISLQNDLRSTITSRVRQLISRSEGYENAATALLKDGLNHRLQKFGPVVDAFLWVETSTLLDSRRLHEGMAFVHSRGLRPSDVGRVTGAPAIRAVAARVTGPGTQSSALTEQLLRADIGTNEWEGLPTVPITALPEAIVLEAEIIRAFRREDHGRVLELATKLSSTENFMRRRRMKRYESFTLLKANKIAELASLIALGCVSDPALIGILPLSDCANRLDQSLRREHADSLAIPIVLDLFSKHNEASLDDVRSYAYEDFLLAHGIERPSQLDGIAHKFNRELLVHYLRYVCVPDVMQVSSTFQSTRELEDERKDVLSMLVKLDPDASKDYETELREVARAQLIHRGVRQVERSKIYVDLPAIRRGFEKAHRETFQRYQALSRAEVGTDDRELETALHEALLGKPFPQQVLEVPKNEANDLLLQMLRWIFEECSGSPEHGLDCYLSMRIRHGTLSGQLRTPPEVERIIVQRAANTNEYESNVYWMKRLDYLEESICEAIDDRLANFSAVYDALIARITGEMIQIQSPEKPAGLFSISLKSVRFRLWIADLTPDMTLETFFDSLMDLFWESVEHSLAVVRRTIDEVVKPEINTIFANLESGIENFSGGLARIDLDRAIRTAHTGTLQALDIVKDWFRLSQPITEPHFPISDLIDVGLQCVTAIHREFEPHVIHHIDPLPPIAGALVLFSDIFFIIFDNIRRHSGVGTQPRVKIEVRDKGDRLFIVVRNEVADVMRTPETIARIASIRHAIAEGGYRQIVRLEGGTGLIKLRKLIGQEEGRPRRLNFDFEGHDFIVELELSKWEIAR